MYLFIFFNVSSKLKDCSLLPNSSEGKAILKGYSIYMFRKELISPSALMAIVKAVVINDKFKQSLN